jgi:hypothetical protein
MEADWIGETAAIEFAAASADQLHDVELTARSIDLS